MLVVQQRDIGGLKAGTVQCSDLHHLHFTQNRLGDFQYTAVFCLIMEQVAIGADIYSGIRHNLLTQAVNRRIGDLGKLLLDIIEQRFRLVRENCQRDIMAHGHGWLIAIGSHRQDLFLDILIGIAEDFIQAVTFFLRVHLYFMIRNFEIMQVQQVEVKPLAIGLAAGIILFQFCI